MTGAIGMVEDFVYNLQHLLVSFNFLLQNYKNSIAHFRFSKTSSNNQIKKSMFTKI